MSAHRKGLGETRIQKIAGAISDQRQESITPLKPTGVTPAYLSAAWALNAHQMLIQTLCHASELFTWTQNPLELIVQIFMQRVLPLGSGGHPQYHPLSRFLQCLILALPKKCALFLLLKISQDPFAISPHCPCCYF